VAQIQKLQCHIDRADSGRIGGNTPLHGIIQVVDQRLGLAGSTQQQSVHDDSSLYVK
jgi:hypothetical protein